MSGKNAKMRDVAEMVGLSQATVSYVLNGKTNARISPQTRQRVLDAAARLNYRPHAIARAMASGRSQTIGVYQPHTSGTALSGMWNMMVMRGIGDALHAHQLHLLLYGYRETENPPPTAFLDGRVDGMIILAPHLDDSLPRLLAEARLPLVLVGARSPAGMSVPCVDVDNILGGYQATEHLIRLGHTRIAHLRGPEDVYNARDRRAGYEMALRDYGIPYREEYCPVSGFDREAGYHGARAALRCPNRPTALFAANDIAAFGAMQACQDMGLNIPEQISLIGYDDIPMCEMTRPPLSTMQQPAQDMGRAAAEILITCIESETPEPGCRTLAATLAARETTAPPPGHS